MTCCCGCGGRCCWSGCRWCRGRCTTGIANTSRWSNWHLRHAHHRTRASTNRTSGNYRRCYRCSASAHGRHRLYCIRHWTGDWILFSGSEWCRCCGTRARSNWCTPKILSRNICQNKRMNLKFGRPLARERRQATHWVASSNRRTKHLRKTNAPSLRTEPIVWSMAKCCNIQLHVAKFVDRIAWYRYRAFASNSEWCQTMLDHDRWK